MGIDDSLVREIVRRLLGVTRPDRIILFGSAATGQMTCDSNIDLLVVAPAPSHTIKGRRKSNFTDSVESYSSIAEALCRG
jgi:predicted nucleotidyltransferase